MRDLHLTHLRAVLIIDDEDVQSALVMLRDFVRTIKAFFSNSELHRVDHHEPEIARF